ncbi:MAG: response regulator transcription factor [Phycisphaerae bacterium]|nr:response regulator transcription factor [Planctomycetota bacterium]MBL7221176.1 response regulator transcription factor [Phycisphaerae bacterium]
MNAETVLIIEDDSALLRGLTDNFRFEGYTVRAANDGEKGLTAALDSGFDLIILDIMLPKINGYEICRRIRAEGLDTPIIMLTAKGQESDILLGLNLGADDYVTKPFSIRELLARANAFLRRRRTATPDVYRFGDCALDMSADRLTRGGAEVPLTPKESGLLKFMVSHAGRALTRDEILRRVWGYDVFVTSRSIDRCVNTIRKKIEPDSARPTFIKTIREIGYRFEIPEDSQSPAER